MEAKKRYPLRSQRSSSNWLIRAAKAIFVEHRTPWIVAKNFELLLKAFGFKQKTARFGHYQVTFRRCTADEAFIQNVLIEEEYFAKGYEPKLDDTVIDIGANIGCFSLAAARRAPKGRIIAIEPFPENIRLLEKNITQNKVTNIEIIAGAVTDTTGTAQLFIGNDTGMHSVKFDTGRGKIAVPGYDLENVFRQHKIEKCNFLKIDCEGAEFDFLPAFSPELWKRIERVAMEFSVPIQDWSFSHPSQQHLLLKRQFGDQLVELLAQNGFQIDAYEDCVGFRAGYIFASKL